MSNPKVALIIGAGPGVGAAVAAKFQELGYSVATASRSGTGKKTKEGYLSLPVDLSKADTVSTLFEKLKNNLGVPSVVVYNAAALTVPPDDAPLAVDAAKFASDLTINSISPYIAAQEAVKGWESLADDSKKTFIFTGNILNKKTLPGSLFLTLAPGKSASAAWIAVADQCYKGKPYRFFYADQRAPDGGPMANGVEPDAHAEFYSQLLADDGKLPSLSSFVKGKGHVKFD